MTETIATVNKPVFDYWAKRIRPTDKAWIGLKQAKKAREQHEYNFARIIWRITKTKTYTYNFNAHVLDWCEYYCSGSVLFILKKTCYRVTDVKFMRVTGSPRDSKTIAARFAVIYLLHRYTPKSSSQIGQVVGGRDHSTVLNAIEQVEIAMKTPAKSLTNKQKMIVTNVYNLSQCIADMTTKFNK